MDLYKWYVKQINAHFNVEHKNLFSSQSEVLKEKNKESICTIRGVLGVVTQQRPLEIEKFTWEIYFYFIHIFLFHFFVF